jgi:hypothetical protein
MKLMVNSWFLFGFGGAIFYLLQPPAGGIAS